MLVQEMTVKGWEKKDKKDRKTSPRLRNISEAFLEHLNLLFTCVALRSSFDFLNNHPKFGSLHHKAVRNCVSGPIDVRLVSL